MNSIYDSKNPAPGVKVAPYIAPRAQGLTMSQVKAARETNWTTPWHRKGGAVGLGMLSAAKISDHALRNGPVKGCPEKYNPVLPTTNAPPGTVRSGTKRRGAKKARKNTVCVYHTPNRREYKRKDGDRRLAYLRATWMRLLTMGNPKLEAEYEASREGLLKNHPERAKELNAIEMIKKLKRAG